MKKEQKQSILGAKTLHSHNTMKNHNISVSSHFSFVNAFINSKTSEVYNKYRAIYEGSYSKKFYVYFYKSSHEIYILT